MLCLQLSFVKLVVLDVLLTGLSLLLEFAALVALRIREPELPRPYRVPGGLAGAIGVGLLPLALLVLTMVRNQVEPVGPINALELGAMLVFAGVPAYWLSCWTVGRSARRKASARRDGQAVLAWTSSCRAGWHPAAGCATRLATRLFSGAGAAGGSSPIKGPGRMPSCPTKFRRSVTGARDRPQASYDSRWSMSFGPQLTATPERTISGGKALH